MAEEEIDLDEGLDESVEDTGLSLDGTRNRHTGHFVPGPWRKVMIQYDDGTSEDAVSAKRRIREAGLTQRLVTLQNRIMKDAKESGSPISYEEALFKAMTRFPPGCFPDWEGLAPQDVHFVNACRTALARKRLKRASIADDMEWIAANLNADDPQVADAPSRTALNWIIDCRVYKDMRRQFWQIYYTKLMGPADSTQRKAESFQDEKKSEDEEFMERTFGANWKERYAK